ncbi:Nucleoporin [Paramicrosporidium saccamoebae]|uniref:Nucleoporin n=1 Tax=Paramicrosporidium saccamoebae TaxID=1246581 RepID=A0A2H9THA3_9FUNG|nr:Nucleoporin [Paramicrosporidium saccamoebae]
MGPRGALRLKVDRSESETGPTRSRAKRVRPAPYARNQSPETNEDGSLLGRVKDIVGWLLPSWFTREPECGQKAVEEQDVQDQDMQDQNVQDYVQEHVREHKDGRVQEYRDGRVQEYRDGRMQEYNNNHVEMDTVSELATEETGAIFRRLTMERESRMRLDTYADLAQYFRQKGDMLLTSEEYEHLALVIQRQAIGQVRSRRDFQTPSTVRRSPRLKTKISIESVPTMEEVEMTLIKETPLRKAKVFSARFEDDGAWMTEKPSVPATPRISENRHRLIEEARNRVYEQIRQSRQLVEGPVETSSLGTLVEKPTFSFTIPVTAPSVSAPAVEEVKHKLIFDFGTIDKPKLDFDKPELDFDKPKLDFDKPKLDFDKPKLEFDKPKLDFTTPKLDVNKTQLDDDKTKPAFTFAIPPPTPETAKPLISFETPKAEPPPQTGTKPSLSTIPEESSSLSDKAKSGFSFGSGNGTSLGTTGFGGSKLEKPTENVAAKTLPFNFGALKPAGTTETPSFSFGAAATVPTTKPTPFAFGTGNPTPAFGADNSAPAFGTSSSTPAFGISSSTPAFGISGSPTAFGVPSSTPAVGNSSSTPSFDMPSSTSAFGLPSSTTALGVPFTAGSSKPVEGAPFSFGATSTASNTNTKSPSGFSFGTKPSEDKPAFSFGSTSKSSGEVKPAGFQFGTTPPKSGIAVAGESAPNSFFNLATPTKPTEKTQFGFSFGAGSTTTDQTMSNQTAFGAGTTMANQTMPSQTAFGAEKTVTSQMTFGAAPAQSSFGATAAVGQTSSFGNVSTTAGQAPSTTGQSSSFGMPSTAGPTSFSFGTPAQSTQQPGFGAPANPVDFNFGAAPPPDFTFGSGAPPAFSAGTVQQQSGGPRKFSVPASRRRK